jgi:hypothetical protein
MAQLLCNFEVLARHVDSEKLNMNGIPADTNGQKCQ